MRIGCARVSKANGGLLLYLQRDALLDGGVDEERIYEDRASGRRDHRPGLDACLKAPQLENTFVVWKLDCLGRDLKHLVPGVNWACLGKPIVVAQSGNDLAMRPRRALVRVWRGSGLRGAA